MQLNTGFDKAKLWGLTELETLIFRVVRLSYSRECDILGTSWQIYFRFGTKVYLDSGMYWLDFTQGSIHCVLLNTPLVRNQEFLN